MPTPICRVCLVGNQRMKTIENVELQNLFEILKGTVSPVQHGTNVMCYICYAYLQRCLTFSEMLQRSDVILNALYNEGFEATQETITNMDIDIILTIPTLMMSSVTYTSTDEHDGTTGSLRPVKPGTTDEEETIEVEGMADQNETLLPCQLKGSDTSKRTKDSVLYHDVIRDKDIETGQYLDVTTDADTEDKLKDVVPCFGRSLTIKKTLNSVCHDKDNIDELPEHVKSKEKLYGCTFCHNNMSFSFENLQKHLHNHNYKGFVCKECHQMFPTYKSLHTHHMANHIDISCDMCNESFTDRNVLQMHVSRIHDGEKSNKNTNPTPLEHHLERKQFKCEICSKMYQIQSNLIRHMSIHEDAKKEYACSYCDKIFKNKRQMSRHIKTHSVKTKTMTYSSAIKSISKTNTYTCDKCGKIFYNKRNISSHIKLAHTNTKRFECELCDKSFKRPFPLKEHKRVHTGEKPFACEVCHKTFSQTSSRNNHRRVHSIQRPYVCEVCNQTFTDKYSMRNHKRLHTGELPYCCDKCDIAFTFNASLRSHKLQCHGELLSCRICSMTFTTWWSLKIHKKKMHKRNAEG